MQSADILSLLLLIGAGIYFFIGFFIHVGLSKKFLKTNHKPKISVLVAARNEEKNLSACLDCLGKQTFPADLLQIIVLNDRSTDATRQIILAFTERFVHFELIDITDDQNGLKGKMNVLAQGMDHAEGEIILITDADCRVPEGWVSEMATYFTKNIGLVGGLTVINEAGKKSDLFDSVQTLDSFFLQASASGTAGINLPVSVLGNNFGFKKNIYDQIGGFRNLGFSLTEDMALLNAIAAIKTYHIVYPLNRGTMIQSLPLPHLREFFQQRKRWLYGGLGASRWGWLLMSISLLIHLLIIVNLLLINISTLVILGLLLKLLIDFSLVWRIMFKSGIVKLKKYLIAFELFYISYTIILAIGLLFPGRILWKERSFKKKDNDRRQSGFNS